MQIDMKQLENDVLYIRESGEDTPILRAAEAYLTLHQSASEENRMALDSIPALDSGNVYFDMGEAIGWINSNRETIRRALLNRVPAGWKLVPIRATDEMVAATQDGWSYKSVWRAMCEAAPTPETTP